MPERRGRHRDRDETPIDGGVVDPDEVDMPDDSIVVDVTDDDESLDWLSYHPEDDDLVPITELSRSEVREQLDKE